MSDWTGGAKRSHAARKATYTRGRRQGIATMRFFIILFVLLTALGRCQQAHAAELGGPERYVSGCATWGDARSAWNGAFIGWWQFNNAEVSLQRSRMSATCRHRFDVLTHAVDTCFERYDEATGNYFYDLWQDGDYQNDWLTHMSPACSWSVEALGYSVHGWFPYWPEAF